ncbi:MAG: class I SAM-dependent methyltransferase [Hyphomicrobiales bacterium]|nr:class I SAM-dependent methyltransferase [Hyphomicrobiales bacterium]
MTWRDFFDRDHSIYVNARHKLLHAEIVAKGVCAHIPSPDARVLDYGCGEALGARYVAARCGALCLFDTAPSVRAKLAASTVALSNVRILDEAGFDALPDASLDMIAIVSVLQYVGEAELARMFDNFRAKLKAGGLLVVGDVVPPDLSPLEDARALLDFGWRGGFLIAAVGGLARTALSDYRSLREKYGLSTYSEPEMRALLAEHGFSCDRAPANIGHNQKRMTFLARKTALDAS